MTSFNHSGAGAANGGTPPPGPYGADLREFNLQQQIKKIVNATPDAVLVVDRRGRVCFVNPAAESLFGRRTDTFAGELLSFSLRDNEALEIDIPRGDERRTGEMRVVPIEWMGEPAYLALIRDITEQARLAEQLRQAQKLESIGRLAGGVAHDFNNLLSIIIGFGDLFSANIGDDPENRRYLDEMLRAAHRAADLTRQLLAFSRRQVLQPRVVDLNEVVGQMQGMISRLIREDIVCDFRMSRTPLPVNVDPAQIEQVVLNLAINARDAMPHGGQITFDLARATFDKGFTGRHSGTEMGRHAMLAVTDTGSGMTKEVQAKIFEPFFTTKDRGHGTGLGLATVHGIVTQSGGHVWVYSEPGLGSTFKVYFPLCDSPALDTEKTPAEVQKGAETVLVVEDEDAVRELIKIALNGAGYKVLAAESGSAALEVSARYDGRIDLVISDVVMPRVSGPELTRQLTAQRPGLQVLYMSGYACDGSASGMIETQDHFISKPFSVQALQRRIRQVFDSRGTNKGS